MHYHNENENELKKKKREISLVIFNEPFSVEERNSDGFLWSIQEQEDSPWLYFISSTSLVMSITALLFRWREEPTIRFSGNFQRNNFNEIFQFLILLCSTLCIPLSVEYIECTEMVITEFLLFILIATLEGMFLCDANDLITIFVVPECFSLCSYLLSRYTKKDVRSNEATMKYLLMGGASSSILVHGLVTLFQPLLANALIYVDDILLFSKDEESHAKLLTKFYNLVKSQGIMLSEKKMVIGQSSIDFLGVNISNGKYTL